MPDDEPVKIIRKKNNSDVEQGRRKNAQKGDGLFAWVIGRRESKEIKQSKELLKKHVLIYKDSDVVKRLRDQMTAQLLRDMNILSKLKKSIIGNESISGQSELDGLAGVDELTVKPSAKWTFGAEVGIDLEMKWLLGSDKNLDTAISILSNTMQELSLEEIVRRHRQQKSDTSIELLVYPTMPVKLIGHVNKHINIKPNEIIVSSKTKGVTIALNCDNKLFQSFTFLKKRPLTILGLIIDIENNIEIEAGAILLEK